MREIPPTASGDFESTASRLIRGPGDGVVGKRGEIDDVDVDIDIDVDNIEGVEDRGDVQELDPE